MTSAASLSAPFLRAASTSADQVVRRNVAVVREALDAAGISYTLHDGRQDEPPTAVVDRPLRDVLEALAHHPDAGAIYLGLDADAGATAPAPVPLKRAVTQRVVVDESTRCALGLFVEDQGTGRLYGLGSAVTVATDTPSTDPDAQPATTGRGYPFPIDVVYTWVDDEDPAWQARKQQALHDHDRALNAAAAAPSRFKNRQELRFSLRSLAHFAPWVNRVFIVTDDQFPPWLSRENPKVRVVDHREIFADPSVLPVFNSHAIESQLHHVPGLAEHYLYMNDDFLLGRPVTPQVFFHANGVARFAQSAAPIPLGLPDENDAPVDAAAKNVRRLIARTERRRITRKFKHVPQPLRRSVLERLEVVFAEDFRHTAESRFRHPTDVSIPSSLAHHAAFCWGSAVPGDLRYRYISLGEPTVAADLDELARRRAWDTFCLNDSDLPDTDPGDVDGLVREFFERYYPARGEFEAEPI